MLLLFDFIDFLEDLNNKLNKFISKYTNEPLFWVITAIVIFLIGCWAIKYFGKK